MCAIENGVLLLGQQEQMKQAGWITWAPRRRRSSSGSRPRLGENTRRLGCSRSSTSCVATRFTCNAIGCYTIDTEGTSGSLDGRQPGAKSFWAATGMYEV